MGRPRKNKQTQPESPSTVSQKSTNKQSSTPLDDNQQVDPNQKPAKPPEKSTKIYAVIVDQNTGETRVLTFEDHTETRKGLMAYVDEPVNAFVFEGTRINISQGPWRYLMFQDGSVAPLFSTPEMADIVVDESGSLGDYVAGRDSKHADQVDDTDNNSNADDQTGDGEDDEASLYDEPPYDDDVTDNWSEPGGKVDEGDDQLADVEADDPDLSFEDDEFADEDEDIDS